MSPSKLILVLGATGAQGQAAVDALLAPEEKSGNPSPYRVRALTRDPKSASAQASVARGVDLEDVYGVWVNTDGFTVGAMREIVVKQIPSLRHYVWSNLPYLFKVRAVRGAPNIEIWVQPGHPDTKGRVAEWPSMQPSFIADNTLSWTVVTSTTYMDMLNGGFFKPMNIRKDGTVVFSFPIGDGRAPMIALKDLAWWACWMFDHRMETSTRELGVASQFSTAIQTFTKVTGKPAVFECLSIDEGWAHFDEELINRPLASDAQSGDPKFDMEWIRRVHAGTLNLEE
ncbi:nmrA-family protein [Mycena olivaceomarginata]|nr:nmrA-family protein [Mycena olivaceomarginata]